jgi:hypothetical protein
MGWIPSRGSFYNPAPPNFDDPIQGSSNRCINCSLIAGISSCVWVNPRNISANLVEGQYNVKFYRPAANPTFPATIWDPSGEYAHSSGPAEIWPMIYEKGYSKLTAGQSAPGTDPDYSQVNWGNLSTIPLNRITPEMSGGPVQQTPANFFNWLTANYTRAAVSNNTYRDKNNNLIANYGSYQVKFPFIAKTNNHTYSVLGALNRNGVKYILIRDPKGPTGTPAGIANNVLLNNFDSNWYVKWYTFNKTGIETDVGIPGYGQWKTIALNGSNGVYGIPDTLFNGTFSQYGFITGL